MPRYYPCGLHSLCAPWHEQALGFFSQYAAEHSKNSGLVPQVVKWWYIHTGFYNALLEHAIETTLLGGIAVRILFLRLHERLSIEAGILVLTGTIFAISPHIFPWYPTALLPWVAVLLQPLWTRQGSWHPDGLAVAMAWYFPCVIVLHYFFDRLPDWTLYYAIVYDVVLIGGGITAYLGIKRRWKERQQGMQEPSLYNQNREGSL